MTILKLIFILKQKYMDIKNSFTNMSGKIWISKKTYTNVRTVTKSANISTFINGINKLLNENITFVDYDDERIAVKLPKLAWLFRYIIHKRIDVHVDTSSSFFISGTENVKCIKFNHLPLNSHLENYKP
jgi:hypothetical protein